MAAYNPANWPVGIAATQTPYGTSSPPPGGRIVAYVRGLAGTVVRQDGDPDGPIFPTVAAAAKQARANAGDVIACLNNHSEVLATADAWADLVAGTRIVSMAHGGLMPSFRWTATTSTLLLNVAGVELHGLRLRLEGANGVVAPITVSAADCAIRNCDIETGSGASNKATTVLTVAAGAARFAVENNVFRGEVAGASTDGILVSGAALDISIRNNLMQFATAATATGLIRFSAAALRAYIDSNVIANMVASSENGIVVGAVAATGVISRNYIAVEAGTPTTGGISLNAASLFRCFENYATDTKNVSGILSPVVVTP